MKVKVISVLVALLTAGAMFGLAPSANASSFTDRLREAARAQEATEAQQEDQGGQDSSDSGKGGLYGNTEGGGAAMSFPAPDGSGNTWTTSFSADGPVRTVTGPNGQLIERYLIEDPTRSPWPPAEPVQPPPPTVPSGGDGSQEGDRAPGNGAGTGGTHTGNGATHNGQDIPGHR